VAEGSDWGIPVVVELPTLRPLSNTDLHGPPAELRRAEPFQKLFNALGIPAWPSDGRSGPQPGVRSKDPGVITTAPCNFYLPN
jgi:hypothetical protein